jgi:hypothetical protein
LIFIFWLDFKQKNLLDRVALKFSVCGIFMGIGTKLGILQNFSVEFYQGIKKHQS